MPTKDDAVRLLQATYYDAIDAGDMDTAASALHPDVDWSHAQVWKHDDLGLGDGGVERLHGRAAVREFLGGVRPHLATASIRHGIRDLVIEDDRGAFLGSVRSRDDDRELPFVVWFALRDGLVSRYTLRPI